MYCSPRSSKAARCSFAPLLYRLFVGELKQRIVGAIHGYKVGMLMQRKINFSVQMDEVSCTLPALRA